VLLASMLALASVAGADVTIPQTDLAVDQQQLEAVAGPAEVTIDEVQVLGPSTVRVYSTVDPNGAPTTVQLQYGTGGVLNLEATSIEVGASAEPVKLVQELVNLKPATAYDLYLSAGAPLGSNGARASFFTGREVFVRPRTGEPVGATASGKKKCTIVGTAKRDRLVGTSKADVICALGGNDVISGRGGNDTIVGGTGKDRIIGAAGRDVLHGNSGNDRLSGGSGNDRLFGEDGNDVLAGGPGRDRLRGGLGRDRARRVTKSDRVRQVEVKDYEGRSTGYRN
jgi:Ca2+-binding RTX toxin-like protein